jgi:hypothetical protein
MLWYDMRCIDVEKGSISFLTEWVRTLYISAAASRPRLRIQWDSNLFRSVLRKVHCADVRDNDHENTTPSGPSLFNYTNSTSDLMKNFNSMPLSSLIFWLRKLRSRSNRSLLSRLPGRRALSSSRDRKGLLQKFTRRMAVAGSVFESSEIAQVPCAP